jgi:hypothetical protein
MTDLMYPDMREELILHLSHLADREYQARVWVAREFPKPGYYDDFDTTYEALEDIVPLSTPDDSVGMTLRNHREAAALQALGTAIDQLFKEHGTKLSDSEYLALPEWIGVVGAAHAALTTLSSQN